MTRFKWRGLVIFWWHTPKDWAVGYGKVPSGKTMLLFGPVSAYVYLN